MEKVVLTWKMSDNANLRLHFTFKIHVINNKVALILQQKKNFLSCFFLLSK